MRYEVYTFEEPDSFRNRLNSIKEEFEIVAMSATEKSLFGHGYGSVWVVIKIND